MRPNWSPLLCIISNWFDEQTPVTIHDSPALDVCWAINANETARKVVIIMALCEFVKVISNSEEQTPVILFQTVVVQ